MLLAALSAFSGGAVAGMPGSAGPSESVPIGGGWRARLFVTPPKVEARTLNPGVDARLSRRIGPGLTLSLDAKNLFDRIDPAPANPFSDMPRTGRGAGIQLRKTF